MFILIASILKMTSRSYEGSHDLVGQTNRVLTMAHIWGMVKINPPGIRPKVVHVSIYQGNQLWGKQRFLTHSHTFVGGRRANLPISASISSTKRPLPGRMDASSFLRLRTGASQNGGPGGPRFSWWFPLEPFPTRSTAKKKETRPCQCLYHFV